MQLLRRLNGRKGMSLIEVLAGLVVFLLGILSVVRMFPGGFFAVKHSENVTLANRLAQAELERWKSKAMNLPAGILGLDPTAPGYPVLLNIDPEDMDVLPGLGPGVNAYYYSDVNKFRHIYAEATKIPAPFPFVLPSSNTTEYRSVYILGFSPIAWNTSSTNVDDSILVYSGPMRRRHLPSNINYLVLRSYSEYAIDYDEAIVYVRPTPNYARNFVISYSYWDNANSVDNEPRLVSVLSEPITILPGDNQALVPAPGGAPVRGLSGFMYIDYASESLHRKFDPLRPADVWSTEDPYQFKIDADNPVDRSLGVLAFNPNGYGYEEQTARGKEPLTAYIDYDVLDWHIIREERKIPESVSSPNDPDLDVKLTLRFIKEAGKYQESDGSTYLSLLPNLPLDLQFGILAVDLESGEWFSEKLGEHDVVPNTSEKAFVVNYKDGIVRFHQAFAGRTFRIYYQADGDWAVQVYKAYNVYRRSYNPGPDYRQYYEAGGIVYFPRCYAGSTVAIDYSYRLPGMQADEPDIYVTGEAYQISKDMGSFGVYTDIASKIESLIGETPTNVQVSKVYGVSVGSRTIWRESGKGFTAGRWRKVDLQTYLTRFST